MNRWIGGAIKRRPREEVDRTEMDIPAINRREWRERDVNRENKEILEKKRERESDESGDNLKWRD